MLNEEVKNVIAKDLEARIASHISRGNEKAYQIIREYHMDEIIKIRDYMMSFIKDNITNPWILNQYFHMAVSELNINLVDLLTPGTKVISDNEKNVRLAI